MSKIIHSGILYVEFNKVLEEMYCELTQNSWSAYRKQRPDLPAGLDNKSSTSSIQIDITKKFNLETKIVKYGISDISRIMKLSKLSETPYFFSIRTNNTDNQILSTSSSSIPTSSSSTSSSNTVAFILASKTEEERDEWITIIKNNNKSVNHSTPYTISRPNDPWLSKNLIEEKYPENKFSIESQYNNKTSSENNPMTSNPLQRKPSKDGRILRRKLSNDENMLSISTPSNPNPSPLVKLRSRQSMDGELDDINTNSNNNNLPPQFSHLVFTNDEEIDESLYKTNKYNLFFKNLINFFHIKRLCGIKIDTIVRFLKICFAFPFVIVVSTLNPKVTRKYQFLQTIPIIRALNILIYVAPAIYVKFVLSQFNDPNIQRFAIGIYTLVYLAPVASVCLYKLKVASSTSLIEDGTFCFKPSYSVHFTQANFYALFGFVMEWLQHVLYVLPTGIVTSQKQTKLSDFPPYISFKVIFWLSVCSTFICGIILILNSTLKGKALYLFKRSYLVWFFVYNVGSPMFVTIVTILFMSLWCDYSVDPPSLYQQPSIQCYGDEHTTMARAGLVAMSIYIIQHTLLPSGTFKETMRDDDLEIMFVPVYLQVHYLLKAIFSGIYVYFYTDNFVRVIALTVINMFLLLLNNYMKPCSVKWINLLRDCFFLHASLSGIISINYLAWPINSSTKGMVISTLSSTVLASSIGVYFYYRYTRRSTEYTIASSFLDLEWQVSRGGSVHPRVLEPLIALTLSQKKSDNEITKKYIPKLVWLIGYPNIRVQFQSTWGLATIALIDDDARLKIHEAGGTKTLFEWYSEQEFIVQLETIAALANLTLSNVVSEDMVVKHKCIPFFLNLVGSNKIKHSQFSAIAIGNLARKESYREIIRKNNGIPTLVNCIMSHNYQKQRYGCLALANMALSPSKDIVEVFESRGLIDRIIKIAIRKEIEIQREVMALIRNLCCHARLRPHLLDRGVMTAVETNSMSVFEDVKKWCKEITDILKREISMLDAQGDYHSNLDLKSISNADKRNQSGSMLGLNMFTDTDHSLLKSMEPLSCCADWSAWGSKLDLIFDILFRTLPTLQSSQVRVLKDTYIKIFLAVGLSKNDLHKWRDSLSYSVLEKPTHGTLYEIDDEGKPSENTNLFSIVKDRIIYIPDINYVGSDFFSYKLNAGQLQTQPVTVAISVVETAAGLEVTSSPTKSPKSPNTPDNNKRHTNKLTYLQFSDDDEDSDIEIGRGKSNNNKNESNFSGSNPLRRNNNNNPLNRNDSKSNLTRSKSQKDFNNKNNSKLNSIELTTKSNLARKPTNSKN